MSEDMIYQCQCCGRPLRAHLEEDAVRLFCTFRSCGCNEMQTGERGGTAWEAYQNLVAQHELWAMQHNI